MVRDRLGELGLGYQLKEVPRSRPERLEVIDVSGQPTVPVLVVEEDGKTQIYSDENAVLEYLDLAYGPREYAPAEPWDEAATQALREAVAGSEDRTEALYALAERARASGEIDRANCLRAAAWYLRDGQR